VAHKLSHRLWHLRRRLASRGDIDPLGGCSRDGSVRHRVSLKKRIKHP
jgi:hypothetical protein